MCDKTKESDERSADEEVERAEAPKRKRKSIKERVQEIRARDAEEVIDENGNDIRIVSHRA